MAAKWTSKEEQSLKQLHEDGLTVNEIANEIGRGVSGVMARMRILGLTPRKSREKKEEPVGTGKGYYKIRYLVDGIEEKLAGVPAESALKAKLLLQKKKEEQYPEGTIDIIRIEEFIPDEEEVTAKNSKEVQEKRRKIENTARTITDTMAPAVKAAGEAMEKAAKEALEVAFSKKTPNEITDEVKKRVEEEVAPMVEATMKEEVEIEKKDPAELKEELVLKHEKFLEREEKKMTEEQFRETSVTGEIEVNGAKMIVIPDLEWSEDSPIATLGSDGSLRVANIALSDKQAFQLVSFCKKIEAMIPAVR